MEVGVDFFNVFQILAKPSLSCNRLLAWHDKPSFLILEVMHKSLQPTLLCFSWKNHVVKLRKDFWCLVKFRHYGEGNVLRKGMRKTPFFFVMHKYHFENRVDMLRKRQNVKNYVVHSVVISIWGSKTLCWERHVFRRIIHTTWKSWLHSCNLKQQGMDKCKGLLHLCAVQRGCVVSQDTITQLILKIVWHFFWHWAFILCILTLFSMCKI